LENLIISQKSRLRSVLNSFYNDPRSACKTSLRERLTETAFWRREPERNPRTRDIRLLFVTTDKDDELRIDTNRYIIFHVMNHRFVTDPNKCKQLIQVYKGKYGDRRDFKSYYQRFVNFLK